MVAANKKWVLLAVTLALAGACSVIGYAYWHGVRPWQQFRAERRTTQSLFEARVISAPAPPGAAEWRWRSLTGFLWTGYVNAFHTPSDNVDEMRQFRLDVEAFLGTVDTVDVETLRWIWRRLGESGGRREAYIKRMTPAFEEYAGRVSIQNVE